MIHHQIIWIQWTEQRTREPEDHILLRQTEREEVSDTYWMIDWHCQPHSNKWRWSNRFRMQPVQCFTVNIQFSIILQCWQKCATIVCLPQDYYTSLFGVCEGVLLFFCYSIVTYLFYSLWVAIYRRRPSIVRVLYIKITAASCNCPTYTKK